MPFYIRLLKGSPRRSPGDGLHVSAAVVHQHDLQEDGVAAGC